MMFAGVLVTGERWPDLLILVAATATAAVTLWRLVVRPISHAVRAVVRAGATFERVAPTLIAIGTQFEPNGGNSLRDSIDRIEASLQARGEKLDELFVYSHERSHIHDTKIAALGKFDETIIRRLDDIKATDGLKIAKLDGLKDAADKVAADLLVVQELASNPDQRPGV